MKTWKPWLLLAVIFVAGMVAGAALLAGLGSHFLRPPGVQMITQHWMAHLTQRLNLTADQQSKIQPILAEAGNELQTMHRDEVERGSQIMERVNAQIATVLTADQKAQLEQMTKEMDQNRERMFPGHHHPGWDRGGPEDGAHHGGPDGTPGLPPPNHATNSAAGAPP